ncbi:MAG TPA: penicillin-binding transpeptidase domain-containing protein [Armatimonadota bacterium]|nr:penicillin-binding transpeptidase domain-containing protein [Armatimonadota bacterium]
MKRRLSYDQFVQRRTKKLFYLLAIAYLVLAARLFYIQVIRAPHFKAKAEELIVARTKLIAGRGTIYDRNGNRLATTVDAYDIGVRPAAVRDKAATAARLAPLIGWETGELLAKLDSRAKPFYLLRGIDAKVGAEVQEAKLAGIDVLRAMKRVYPCGGLASHIIGFTDVDGRGIAGLEKSYNKELRGADGYSIAERDARGKIIPGSRRERVEPVHGDDLVLTIDSTIQRALETYLEDSFSTYSAAGASAVVMDPKTGEILALANMPTFDPNEVGKSDPASRRNRAVTDLYEPGSTLKTVTACAALEEKAIDLDDTFYCSGSMRIGRRTIRCSLHPPFMNGHGACNVAKVLRYSCNMGAAGIGLRLGKEKLYAYEKAFGLYEKPGSGLLGEVCGWHDRWQDWADVRLANIAFGQGIAVTPLQMARAYAAVANGGVLMRPYVVKEMRFPDGRPEKVFGPHTVRRVVSEETAGLVSEMLCAVVSGGTGKTARVDGYRVAGKTGSAQKASTTGRGYASGKFVASFVGFLPISDPRVVIFVLVDEPKGIHWGATVAAPVFQSVARKAMWHMKVPPDDPTSEAAPVAGGTGKTDQGGGRRGSPSHGEMRG